MTQIKRLAVAAIVLGAALIMLNAGFASAIRDMAGLPDQHALEQGAPPPGSLRDVRVVEDRPSVPGYDRDCGTEGACAFGPAWSDAVTVTGGHNGCDTRNDILRRDLHDVALEPGTNDCTVLSGTLTDPYTGERVIFDRHKDPAGIQIDHVIALAAAWDHGAAEWTPELRQDFANDPANLQATTGRVNQSKGDKTPAEWMPNTGQCQYARTYTTVTASYGLTISGADARELDAALSTC